MDTPGDTPRRRVRVWFGRHIVAVYSADHALADRYAAALRSRFAGLQITIDDQLAGAERPVPCERLWDLAP